MLCALLELVRSQAVLSLLKPACDVFQLLSLLVDVARQLLVIALQAVVLITLFGVQIVEARLICILDLLDLLLVRTNLVLCIPLFRKQRVKMLALLVICVLNVKEKSVNVLRFGVTAMLVESQVVVSELTLILTHVFDKDLVLAFHGQVSVIVLVDIFNFLLHLGDFIDDVIVLRLKLVAVIGAVIDLTTRARSFICDARQAAICNRSINRVHFRVVTNTR